MVYLPGAIATKNHYINYEWPIAFDELQCYGNESSIWNCSYIISDNGSSCTQSDDAAVICMGMFVIHNGIIYLFIMFNVFCIRVWLIANIRATQ